MSIGRIKSIGYLKATEETLALLKILALGNQQVTQGRVKPLSDVVKRLRADCSAADYPPGAR
jgi:hypothetical protein